MLFKRIESYKCILNISRNLHYAWSICSTSRRIACDDISDWCTRQAPGARSTARLPNLPERVLKVALITSTGDLVNMILSIWRLGQPCEDIDYCHDVVSAAFPGVVAYLPVCESAEEIEVHLQASGTTCVIIYQLAAEGDCSCGSGCLLRAVRDG